MPNKILTTHGWQERVRNKLGVDENYLPNAIIEQPEHINIAEEYAISHVPNYDSIDDDARIWLEAAVVAKCASIICPILKVIVPVREQGPHFTRDLTYNWDRRKKELEDECDMHLSVYMDSPGGPKGFRVHNG